MNHHIVEHHQITLIQAKAWPKKNTMIYYYSKSAICGGTCSGRSVIVGSLAGFFCMLSERTGEMETSHKFRELAPLNKESNREAAKSRS